MRVIDGIGVQSQAGLQRGLLSVFIWRSLGENSHLWFSHPVASCLLSNVLRSKLCLKSVEQNGYKRATMQPSRLQEWKEDEPEVSAKYQ